jgi:hypothetical protein
MEFKLLIELAGLCLFVHEEEPTRAGVYILMPHGRMPNGHVHKHSPRLGCDAIYTDDGEPANVPLPGVISLRNHQQSGPIERATSPLFAKISEFLGKSVRSGFLNGAVSGNRLATRIELPLLTEEIEVLGTTGTILVKGPGTIQEVVGRALVTMTIDGDDDDPTVEIAGKVLRPVSGVVKVSLTNLPKRAKRPKKGDHTHATAYYGLFFEPTEPVDGPEIEVEDPGDDPSGAASLKPNAKTGVEPTLCTIGEGCPESNQNC